MRDITDNKWLAQITGDPFVDVGGMVIDFLRHDPLLKSKSMIELIEFAVDIYIDNWQAKLHPFFLNSTITQAQFIGERKKLETIDYFTALLDESFPGKMGFCEISGQKTKLFAAGRNNQILSGSGTFVNYHANLQPAVYLSKEVLIRIFFVPLGIHRLSDKLALVVSNNPKISQFFVFQNCIANLSAVKANASSGPLKSIFRNPANSLFRFVDDYGSSVLNTLNTEENHNFNADSTSINLYHFSNLGQKPEMVLHSLNEEVFSFYTYCNTAYKEDWNIFVRAHYSPENLKKSFFNEETKLWQTKEGEEITFEEYQKWKNFVLHYLLNGISLLKYFLKWSIRHPFPFEIVKTYVISFRKMQELSVKKIDAIATLIASQPIRYSNEMIDSLNNVMKRAELRKIFMEIQELAYQQHAKDAIISTEEYVEVLLPVGASWSELRDVLTISIYQKLFN